MGHDQAANFRAMMPFAEVLGIELVEVSPSRVVARAEWKHELTTAGGLIHGGYLMAAADAVGALLAFTNMPEGSTTSTIESKTNFFRPIREGQIRFVATPLNVGNRVVVVETDAFRADGELATRTTQSQIVIKPT
jgi:uncharacterized protein (TIGR00369 family)